MIDIDFSALFQFTDLRMLGQTTRIERSTVEQVRARIAMLREKTKEASKAKAYDFNERIAAIKAEEDALRAKKKAEKKAKKEQARMEVLKDTATQPEDIEMAQMMGFGGFGSSKKWEYRRPTQLHVS